ncbi:hypothetical protein AGRA3207_007513 [Actinomadura graeca]|uniref:DUF222 domain-containing protein n=1 Tax=Actinomadura graeca TaxID=2750812 RepID=A0ABX8R6Q4_9ACTN|nr:hypothetical protein [Actinomadura graeca]QXJ25944.1 hypothetical protein AGRA3207_007513 [Actinomadura graeca]
MTDHVRDNIRTALQALIPQAIAELQEVSFEQRRARAAAASQIIAERADRLMFAARSRPGVLGPLAEGLAVLAFQPGGVTALGLHACTAPHIGCPSAAAGPHPRTGRVVDVEHGHTGRPAAGGHGL